MNLNLQYIATKALRKGLIDYDKRKGWRGPLKNIQNFNYWNKTLRLEKLRLEKSIGWELAILKKIEKFSASIESENNNKGIINYENISCTIT